MVINIPPNVEAMGTKVEETINIRGTTGRCENERRKVTIPDGAASENESPSPRARKREHENESPKTRARKQQSKNESVKTRVQKQKREKIRVLSEAANYMCARSSSSSSESRSLVPLSSGVPASAPNADSEPCIMAFQSSSVSVHKDLTYLSVFLPHTSCENASANFSWCVVGTNIIPVDHLVKARSSCIELD